MNYNFRGVYDSAQNYAKKDVVAYQPTISDPIKYYLCLTAQISSSPQTPSVTGDTTYWGLLNAQSNFPNSVDDFLFRKNISSSDKNDVNRYQVLSLKPSLTPEEAIEFNNITVKLRDKLIAPDDLNKLQESIQNLQFFIKTNVDGYVTQKQTDMQSYVDTKKSEILASQTNAINTIDSKKEDFTTYVDTKKTELSTSQVSTINTMDSKKNEFTAYVDTKKTEVLSAQTATINTMDTKKNEFTSYVDTKKTDFDVTLAKFSYQGNYSGSTQYYKWNTVKYNNEVYLCINDSLGNNPTDSSYWLKMASKGDTGSQGLAGLGLVYRGTYDGMISYNVQDAVNYGGSIFYCKLAAPIGVNPSDSTYWTLFMSKQNIPISDTPPSTPSINDMWLDTGGSNVILKYYNGTTWIGLNAVNADKLGGLLPSAYEKTANRGQVNGYASLDNTGDVPLTQLKKVTPSAIGAETPTGAQTKADAAAAIGIAAVGTVQSNLDNHKNATTAHGAVSEPTANAMMVRDASGRAQVATPSAAADIARKDTVDAVQIDLTAHLADYTLQIPYAVTTGSANTYAVTLSPALTTYSGGVAVAVKINAANTGASTINVNGLGAKSILDSKGNALTSGKLTLNSVYTLRYNGTAFILQGEGGEYGTAIASDVLTGKTIGTDSGLVNGTMPNNGAVSITPGTTNKSVAAGYHNGSGVVVGDADLIAGNIKNGVDIFGVVGNVIQASGNAVAGDVLTGKTASNSSGAITGSMPNQGAPTWTPGTGNQGLAAGYYSGGTVLGSGNLVAGNILSGVNIFGVVGNVVAGKRNSSGSGTLASNKIFTVTGLSFTPRIVLIYVKDTAGQLYSLVVLQDYLTEQLHLKDGVLTNNTGTYYGGYIVAGYTFQSGGFTVNGIQHSNWAASAGAALTWYAYE